MGIICHVPRDRTIDPQCWNILVSKCLSFTCFHPWINWCIKRKYSKIFLNRKRVKGRKMQRVDGGIMLSYKFNFPISWHLWGWPAKCLLIEILSELEGKGWGDPPLIGIWALKRYFLAALLCWILFKSVFMKRKYNVQADFPKNTETRDEMTKSCHLKSLWQIGKKFMDTNIFKGKKLNWNIWLCLYRITVLLFFRCASIS